MHTIPSADAFRRDEFRQGNLIRISPVDHKCQLLVSAYFTYILHHQFGISYIQIPEVSFSTSNFFSAECALASFQSFKVNREFKSVRWRRARSAGCAQALGSAQAHSAPVVAPGLSAMADASGEVAAVPAPGPINGLSNGAGATPAQPNNPLSRKLHKILETRLDNDKVPGVGRGRREGPASLSPSPAARPAAERPPRAPGDSAPAPAAAAPGAGRLRPGSVVSCHRLLCAPAVFFLEHLPTRPPRPS